MGFLRRRTNGSVSGLPPEDAQLLKQLRQQGADLAEPRHVLHYSYFPSEHTTRLAAEAADANGWSTAVSEPLPDFPGQWSMRAERPDVVLSDDVVRDSTDFFQALAAEHSGEYDGWEAAVR